MVFVACGLNHTTAPITIREKIAKYFSAPKEILASLLVSSTIKEAVILSTCNRLECYFESPNPDAFITWLIEEHGLPKEQILPFFYIYQGVDALNHILGVAVGLDSMMLGEPQIFGQMKQAYQDACQVHAIQSNLRGLFEFTFAAAKRIRNKSGIGLHPVSMAYAAVELLNKSFKTLDAQIFIIGSGDTATLVAKYLQKQGIKNCFIASRTLENAQTLASSLDANAVAINDIPEYLPKADIVITATACPLPFIHKPMVEQALKLRNNAPMFFIDLSLPRDIDPPVGDLEHVTLHNIDDLKNRIDQGMDQRREAAIYANALIKKELENYTRWHRSLKAKDVICNYRERMQTLVDDELERAKAHLAKGLDQEQVLYDFSRRLLDKLSHSPTLGLKKAAIDGREDLLSLIPYLFNPTCDPIPHEEIA